MGIVIIGYIVTVKTIKTLSFKRSKIMKELKDRNSLSVLAW